MEIFVIVGASGAGKTSIARKLEESNDWVECKSHTTRTMRDGEVNGKDYYFIDEETFNEMLANGEFAENVTYDGNQYGISKEEIEAIHSKGNNCFIIANYDGYKQIKKIYPESKSIFVYARVGDCLTRMKARGDSTRNAHNRISTYQQEVAVKDEFDFVVNNIGMAFDRAVNDMTDYVRSFGVSH